MGNLNNQTWDELWNSPEAEKVRATEVLKGIKCDGLPKSAKMYLILLNMHLYIPALLAAKLITVIRGK